MLVFIALPDVGFADHRHGPMQGEWERVMREKGFKI